MFGQFSPNSVQTFLSVIASIRGQKNPIVLTPNTKFCFWDPRSNFGEYCPLFN